MAAVSVTNSKTRLTAADATTGFANDPAGGPAPSAEADLFYQLTSGTTGSASRKIGTTKSGHAYTHGSTTDMTAGDNKVWIAKGVWSNNSALVAAPSATH